MNEPPNCSLFMTVFIQKQNIFIQKRSMFTLPCYDINSNDIVAAAAQRPHRFHYCYWRLCSGNLNPDHSVGPSLYICVCLCAHVYVCVLTCKYSGMMVEKPTKIDGIIKVPALVVTMFHLRNHV